MPARDLFFEWLGVVLIAPILGCFLGQWVQRALSRRAILLISFAALMVIGFAFTRVSLPGVLADHIALMAAYAWLWMWAGMVRNRIFRASFLVVPALGVMAYFVPAVGFFLVIGAAEVTQLPRRSIALDCGRDTLVVRSRLFGWVPASGYEMSVHSRPWGLPLEFRRGIRRFDDGQYPDLDKFTARVAGDGDCTTVIGYNGHDEWRVK